MRDFDVVIIGAGLAGLECARLLARGGVKILLADIKNDLTKGIHTTGIFVRKTFEDFDFPAGTLGKPVRDVTLYSPSLRPLRLKSKFDEFRVGKMGPLYETYLREAMSEGAEFSSGTRYVSALPGSDEKTETIVTLERGGKPFQIRTKVLVGADGARSRVARDLRLDENREVIVGYEEVYRGVPMESEPRLHCFLDNKLAPGYLAWVTNDGEEVHIGVGGYPEKFNPRAALVEFLRLESSVQGLARLTTQPVTIHDVDIPAGVKVMMLYASGNRDEREYGPDAEQLDITREVKRHLAFSSGAHFCIGSHFARLQARVAFEELLARQPRIGVDRAAGRRLHSSFTRGWLSLPATGVEPRPI